jgi:hypothetical protein
VWRRALRLIVITALALQASYVLVANVLLMTPLLRWAVPRLAHEKVNLNWSSAWTVWWCHVHVTGFSMQFDDGHAAQIDLRVARATTDVRLWAIADRRLLLEHVRAAGVSFRMTAKVTAETVHDFPRRIDAFPPVPGFATVAQDPYREWTPPAHLSTLWAYELRDIIADAHELWIDEFRYQGMIRAVGSFDFEPRRKLWVVADGRFDPGTLTAGEHVISQDLALEVHGQIAEVPLDPEHSELIARATTATLHADMGLAGLNLVSLYSDNAVARGGTGQVSLSLTLDEGVFSSESAVQAKLDGIDGTLRGVDLSGEIDLTAGIDERGKILTHLTASGQTVFPEVGGVRLRADTGPIDATAQLSTSDLAAGLRFEQLVATADQASLQDATELVHSVYLLSKLAFAAGPATASVTAMVTPTAVWIRLLDARVGDATAQGAAVYAGHEWRGAAELRLGHLLLAARFAGDKLHPELFPRENWLKAQLEALGFRRSGS